MDLKIVKLDIPDGCNIILGQTHFIKSIEDLHEALVTAVPNIKFGLAFCEASGPCLIRSSGTDMELKKIAEKNAMNIGAGHSFIILLKDTFPINILDRVKQVQEVCSVFCATANPAEVVIAETELGRGIMGVIDGGKPKGFETEKDAKERKEFLRKIGYKL